uniref:DNA repair endonuclease XPF n=2 Tax=Lygus hesperus TaxID=30085 RepID=A0A0A9ZJ13_LYGHE
MMLEFENQMLLDVLNNNSLIIAAKGLSIETVVLNLIKVHCDPGNLVFVLGATTDEEQYFISELESQNVAPVPKVINAEVSGEREEVYLAGGVFFISSRILVVDFLKNRVPIDKVTGIIVLKAHRILEKAQEAFSLRLFRQKNRTGFINAFSRAPQTFSCGILKLERIMKSLFVTELNLWPRFHAVVNASLKEKQPEVIELHIELSSYMNSIQTAVLDCVHFCTKEIKRINPSLDTEDVTVENALSKQYYKLLQSRLDPIWNQLSSRTKQLIADLKTLRLILEYLTQSDCVRLHQFLSSLRSKEYTSVSGGWMILDAAENIFVVSKKRIFDDKKELKLEPNPKWKTLIEIMKEVQLEEREKDTQPSVLVLVQNQSTVHQLKQILTLGEDAALKHWYYQIFGNESLKKDKPEAKTDDEISVENCDTVTLTQKLAADGDGNSTFFETTIEDAKPEKDLLISIQPFKKEDDGLFLNKSLTKLKPDAIVMYDTDITAIRQIEIYQRAHADNILKIFFLIYGGSVEEQVYLTSLRQEKLAFEKLIMEKKVLVMEDVTEVFNEVASVPKNTREGGQGSSETVVPKIIVDMREFRSELPSLLHKRGIEIEPVTIQVGDYILSPEMCVERKSISDLIGSLGSGRLYTQALAMTRHYAKPILLIEFDENKPFALQGRYYLSNDISNNDIQSKLQLLTLHFPRLRLVWSHSPFASAQLLHELKEGKEEPSASAAAAIGLEDAPLEDELLDKYNIGIQDFVSKLPGVNSKNIRVILNKGKSLSHLLTLSQEELGEMLGNKANAELLYNALHATPTESQDASTSSFRAKPKNRPFRKRTRNN